MVDINALHARGQEFEAVCITMHYLVFRSSLSCLNTVLNSAMITLLCIHSLDVRDLFSRTSDTILSVDCVWNLMAHAQKPDFVFRRNGRVHLNRRWASAQSTTGSRGGRISGSNAGYTMFRGSVKGTGYPLYSPVSPSLPLPCITVYHHISAGV